MASPRMEVGGLSEWIVLAIGVLAGAGVVAREPTPTGAPLVDAVLVIATTTFIVWCAASAPWWAGVVVAGLACALTASTLGLVLAFVALVGGLIIGRARRAVPWSRALVAALSIQALADSRELVVFGGSAVVVVTILAGLAFLGIRRRPRRVRRRVWALLAAVGGAAVLAFVGLTGAAAGARSDLEQGNRAARDGLSQLSDGDFEAAGASLQSSARFLEDARQDLGGALTQPARFMPIVAQNRRSTLQLLDGATDAVRVAAAELDRIDFDALKIVNGRIDTQAIAALAAPMERLNVALTDLRVALEAADDPWLVAPLQDRLDEFTEDVADQTVNSQNALTAIQQAPAMLGADGPRVYFIAFTTPSEARGLGGFMGNWAELTIDDGHLQVTDFGRHTQLTAAAEATAADGAILKLDGLDEFVDQYGSFGFEMPPDGRVAPDAWVNVTFSPDFPTVAQTISQMYPASGGRQLDGVFVLDIYGIAGLIELVGPLDVSGVDDRITGDTAVDFLLSEQYRFTDFNERVDALDQVAQATVQRLLTTNLPDPQTLGDLFSPLAAEGRLAGWAVRPEEQDVFTRLKMSGALPPLQGGDGFAITMNNGSGNKIEYYLDGEVLYDVDTTGEGEVQSTMTIDLHNNAPAVGLPDYVIGNVWDLPKGTNREYLSLFTALPVTGLTVDGEPVEVYRWTESGYYVTSLFVVMPPGQGATLQVQLAGALAVTDPYSVVVRNPPAVGSLATTLVVDGETVGQFDDPGIHHYARHRTE